MVIDVDHSSTDPSCTIGGELPNLREVVRTAIDSGEIKNVIPADARGVEHTRILLEERPAGSGVQIRFNNQTFGRGKQGDAERQRARGVGQIDDTAAIGLNRIGARRECQRLPSVEGGVDVFHAAGDVAIAVRSEGTDAGEKAAGGAV